MTDAAGNQDAGQGGAPTPPWYEGKAPTEIVGFWQNKNYDLKDPATVAIESAKAAFELQKHFGAPADRIVRLPKDATDEAGWREVYARIGAPSDPKDYDFSSVKRPDGNDIDAALADTMRAVLHKAAVRKDAAADVVKAVVKHLGDSEAAQSAERAAKVTADMAELRKSWGTNWEFNRLTAMQGAKRLGVSDDEFAKLESTPGGTRMMEMFRRVGAGTTEDTFAEGKQSGGVTTSPGAVARKQELMSDTAWVKRFLDGGAAEVREMAALDTLIAGS